MTIGLIAKAISAIGSDNYFNGTLSEEQQEAIKDVINAENPNVLDDAVQLDDYFRESITEEQIEAIKDILNESNPERQPDAVELDDYFRESITEEQLEIMKDKINEGLNPGDILNEGNFPEAICQSISAKITMAAANGDVTTVEIEAIICDEFGVNSLEELQNLVEENPQVMGDKPDVDFDKPLPDFEDIKPEDLCGGKVEGAICFNGPSML